MSDPGEEDPILEEMPAGDDADDEETAREQTWGDVIDRRNREENSASRRLVFAIAAPGWELPYVLRSHFRCLGCGIPLPAWRGSWCDACIEWGD